MLAEQTARDGSELIADPDFAAATPAATSLYWRTRCAGSAGGVQRLARQGGLLASSPSGAPLVIENGTWGSRLFFDAPPYQLRVDYASSTALLFEICSLSDAKPLCAWRLPACEEPTAFEEAFDAGTDPATPCFARITLPAGGVARLHRVSVVPVQQRAQPTVMLGIVTYQRREAVTTLLEQVRALDYPGDRLRVAVVDNACTDGTADRIRERFPDVTVLRNAENLGGSGGFNRFFEHVLGTDPPPAFAWILDDDAQIDRNTLKHLVRALESRPDAAAAGSVMMDLERPERAWEAGGSLFEDRFGWKANLLLQSAHELREVRDRTWEVGYAGAYSLLFRPEVLRAAGLWRNYFLRVDDSEWCYRVRERTGRKVLVALDSLIWHVLHGARKPFTHLRAYETRNFLHYFAARGSRRGLVRVLGYAVAMASRQALLRRLDLAGYHVLGIDAFFAGRYGRLDLTRSCVRAPDLPAALEAYRADRGHAPARVVVVTELNGYVGDGFDHEADLVRQLRVALPDATILTHGHRDLAKAGAHGRIPPLAGPRIVRLLRTLRATCFQPPGLVLLPFANESIYSNGRADVAAVYEDGGFSIYGAGRRAVARELSRIARRALGGLLRIARGRYDTAAAEVPIRAAEKNEGGIDSRGASGETA